MEYKIEIDTEITVVTIQVTPEQLEQAAQEGFKSVLNLRSPDEPGFLKDQQQQAEAAGLEYANIPVKVNQISDKLTNQIFEQIEQLSQPILIHCKSGMRSGVMALMYVATRQGMTAEQALEKGKQIGLNWDAHPPVKHFFQNYITNYKR